jgi:hypothetical protein
MTPLTLLIIRHAEKPDEAWPGPGFTENGIKDHKSLVIRGWQRAGAWAALFGAGLGSADYPRPDMIYAARPGDPGRENHGPSRRPAETVSALALRLGLAVKTAFALSQEADLMAEILGLSGVVLISWEHHAIIGGIVPRIPIDHGSPPKHWPANRFDVVLRFDRAEGAAKFSFHALYPRLLSGDSAAALDG